MMWKCFYSKIVGTDRTIFYRMVFKTSGYHRHNESKGVNPEIHSHGDVELHNVHGQEL